MSIEVKKPDLYYVLLKRKRTVANFLENSGVVTLDGLQALLNSLEAAYSVSEIFKNEALEHVASLQSETDEVETTMEEVPEDHKKGKPTKKSLKRKKNYD